MPGPKDWVEGTRSVSVVCPRGGYYTDIKAGEPMQGDEPRWGRIRMWWQALLGRAGGYSSCGRCRRPWNMVRPHMTNYAPGRSCFPLCEGCWRILTPAQRVPYYVALVDEWERQGPPVGKERRMMVTTAAELGL